MNNGKRNIILGVPVIRGNFEKAFPQICLQFRIYDYFLIKTIIYYDLLEQITNFYAPVSSSVTTKVSVITVTKFY
jgi:hypothetical protein